MIARAAGWLCSDAGIMALAVAVFGSMFGLLLWSERDDEAEREESK